MPASLSWLMRPRISDRSMLAPQAVVASAIRNRLVLQTKGFRRENGCWWSRLKLPGQSVEDHIAAEHPGTDSLGAGRLDWRQAVVQNSIENLHHLPVAISRSAQLLTDPPERTRQDPGLEWRAIAQRPWLARQHRNVVPRIVDRLLAPEAAFVLGQDLAVLANDDPVGIGGNLGRPPNRLAGNRIFVVVKADQTGLRHRGG